MGNWVAEYHLGRVVGEDRLRYAEAHRRAVSSEGFRRLPALLQAMFAVLV
jgi:hypothetical protein